MKKLSVLLIVLAMAFTFAACNNVAVDKNDDPVITVEEPVTPDASEPEADTGADVPHGDYQTVYEHNGAVIACSTAAEADDDGDLNISIRINALSCPDNIAVSLSDCTVNGFEVSAPSQLMCMSGSENEVILNISPALMQYGIRRYADVRTGFNIYTFDAETHEVNLPAIARLEPVELTTAETDGDTQPSVPDTPIFDRDGVKIYSIRSEEEMYSCLNLYIVNETGGDITAVPTELVMNGEKQDVDYSFYAVSVKADSSAFAVVVLPNFTIDEETWAVTKFEVTDYTLDFTINSAAS